MPLIKQGAGPLDQEDYFLTGSLTDFLGGGICSRKDGVFTLHKGEIKRNFPYSCEFAVTVKTEAASGTAGQRLFFAETGQRKLGIAEEAAEDPAPWWRLTLSDGFLQGFRSLDGEAWDNAGGCHLTGQEAVIFLGFQVKGDAVLRFSSCTAYCSPFLRVRNFPENFTAKLLDKEGGAFKAEPFGADMTARIVLDAPIRAAFQVCSLEGTPVYEGEMQDLVPGEVYLYTDKSLELWQGDTVLDYGPTTFGESAVQLLRLRNAGEQSEQNLTVSAAGQDAAGIDLSLDGTVFAPAISISSLAPQQEVSFYVRLPGDAGAYRVRDFELVVS